MRADCSLSVWGTVLMFALICGHGIGVAAMPHTGSSPSPQCRVYMPVLMLAGGTDRCDDCCISPNTWRLQTSDYGDDYGFCCNEITHPKDDYNDHLRRSVCIDKHKTKSDPELLKHCPKYWELDEEQVNVCYWKN